MTHAEELKAAQVRVDSKLRYAGVHLDGLRKIPRRGSDFERAHQESYLFHLFGVRDALLQEMNLHYTLGIQRSKVTIRKLESELQSAGTTSKALAHMITVERDSRSWLNCAKDMRDHVTHRASVQRKFYWGGAKHNQASLVDTRTSKEIDRDYLGLYEDWHSEMGDLITDVRRLM